MAAGRHSIQGNTNLCCMSTDSPKKPVCANPAHQFRSITSHCIQHTKIATAELIMEEAVCSTCEEEQLPSTDHGVLLHPIPHDITESQKEQFLAMLSHYSCVIAQGPNDLGHNQV